MTSASFRRLTAQLCRAGRDEDNRRLHVRMRDISPATVVQDLVSIAVYLLTSLIIVG
ncbi:hypothetical protein [Nonomuraea sp. NPDC050691]|uniref:hypothetical protein n=1 Tax=Nonomuraea sp. NPDC050691 TaxID=3155661 RepID=UPI00340F5EB0